MARKGKTAGRAKAPRGFDARDGRIKAIETYDDVEMDGEDEFHSNRDKVLLEHTSSRAYDDSDDEEAVFGLNLPQNEDEEYDEEVIEDDEEDEDEKALKAQLKREKESKKKAKAKGKGKEKAELSQAATTTPDDEDDTQGEETSEDEEEGWGKAYHVLPTAGPQRKQKKRLTREEQEERRRQQEEEERMEVEEAARIRRRLREGLVAEDFGVGEDVEKQWREMGLQEQGLGGDKLDPLDKGPARQQIQAPRFSDPSQAIAFLLRQSPETLALVDDFRESLVALRGIHEEIQKLEASNPEHPSLSISHLQYQTLLAYLSTLTFYFHLRSSPESQTSSRSTLVRKVLSRLHQFRKAMSSMEEIDLAINGGGPDYLDLAGDGESDDEIGDIIERMKEAKRRGEEVDWDDLRDLLETGQEEDEDDDDEMGEVEEDELRALMQDVNGDVGHGGVDRATKGKKRTRDEIESEAAPKPQKKRKRSKKNKASEVDNPFIGAEEHDELLHLNVPTASKNPKGAAEQNGFAADSDYLDPSALSLTDALDKAHRKKSLRFYTAKIDAKANKREGLLRGTTRGGGGGDEDIPYRDKEAARRAILQRQNRQSQLDGGGAGADLDDSEWGEADVRTAREVLKSGRDVVDEGDGGMDVGDDGYYDLVKKTKGQLKAKKKEEYDLERAEAAAARYQELADTEKDGPRTVSRSIMKNKGLTPKRSKEVRNPRVKKRMRYEKAQKKIASQKPVYDRARASEGRGGDYGGEKTGISRNLVKSVKLGSK